MPVEAADRWWFRPRFLLRPPFRRVSGRAWRRNRSESNRRRNSRGSRPGPGDQGRSGEADGGNAQIRQRCAPRRRQGAARRIRCCSLRRQGCRESGPAAGGDHVGRTPTSAEHPTWCRRHNVKILACLTAVAINLKRLGAGFLAVCRPPGSLTVPFTACDRPSRHRRPKRTRDRRSRVMRRMQAPKPGFSTGIIFDLALRAGELKPTRAHTPAPQTRPASYPRMDDVSSTGRDAQGKSQAAKRPRKLDAREPSQLLNSSKLQSPQQQADDDKAP